MEDTTIILHANIAFYDLFDSRLEWGRDSEFGALSRCVRVIKVIWVFRFECKNKYPTSLPVSVVSQKELSYLLENVCAMLAIPTIKFTHFAET